ncbi:MAG: hypothetical protein IPL46_11305 [Saprospiraceae bacterium]|nr:hypothetical protein [Saprospiraceae bacterium]
MKITVEYRSGFADYAEWRERADVRENISQGDIAGVLSGKITKRHLLSGTSYSSPHNPIMVGNSPQNDKLHLGNNIAFMANKIAGRSWENKSHLDHLNLGAIDR